jgi:hypothetical protein
MDGLSLSTLKQDGHGGLCGLDRRSVIPYVHGEWELYCSMLFKRWLGSCLQESKRTCLVFARAFYSSRPDSYNET